MEFKQTVEQSNFDYKDFIKYTNQALSIFSNVLLDTKVESLFTFNMLIQSGGVLDELNESDEKKLREECEKGIYDKREIIEEFIKKNEIHPDLYKGEIKHEFKNLKEGILKEISSCKRVQTGYMKNLIDLICKTNSILSKKKIKLNDEYYCKIIYIVLVYIGETVNGNFDINNFFEYDSKNIVKLNKSYKEMVVDVLDDKFGIKLDTNYIDKLVIEIHENYLCNKKLLDKYNSQFDIFLEKYKEILDINKSEILSNLSKNIFTESYSMHNNIFKSTIGIYYSCNNFLRLQNLNLGNPKNELDVLNINNKITCKGLVLFKKIQRESILSNKFSNNELIEFNKDMLNIVNLKNLRTGYYEDKLETIFHDEKEIDLNTENYYINENLLDNIFKYLRRNRQSEFIKKNYFKKDKPNVNLYSFKYNPLEEFGKIIQQNFSEFKLISNLTDLEERNNNLILLIFLSLQNDLKKYLDSFRNFNIDFQYNTSKSQQSVLREKIENLYIKSISYNDNDINKLRIYWEKLEKDIKSEEKEKITNEILEIIEKKYDFTVQKNISLENIYNFISKRDLLAMIAFKIKLLYICNYKKYELVNYKNLGEFISNFEKLYYEFSNENQKTKKKIKESIIKFIDSEINLEYNKLKVNMIIKIENSEQYYKLSGNIDDLAYQNEKVLVTNLKKNSTEILDIKEKKIIYFPKLLDIQVLNLSNDKFFFSIPLDLNFDYNIINQEFLFQEFLFQRAIIEKIEKEFIKIDLFTFMKLINDIKINEHNSIKNIINDLNDKSIIFKNHSIDSIRKEYTNLICKDNFNCEINIKNKEQLIESKYNKLENKCNEIIEKFYLSAYKFFVLENSFKSYDFSHNSICCTISAILCHLNLKISNNNILSTRDKIIIIMFYLYQLNIIKLQDSVSTIIYRSPLELSLRSRKNELTGLSFTFQSNILKIIKGFIFIYFYDMKDTDIIDSSFEFKETFLGVEGEIENDDLKYYVNMEERIKFNYDEFLSNNKVNLHFIDYNGERYLSNNSIFLLSKKKKINKESLKIKDHIRVTTGYYKDSIGYIVGINNSEEIIKYDVMIYKNNSDEELLKKNILEEDLEPETMYNVESIKLNYDYDYDYLYKTIQEKLGIENVAKNIKIYKKDIIKLNLIYKIINKADYADIEDLKKSIEKIPFKLKSMISKKDIDIDDLKENIKKNIKYEISEQEEILDKLEKYKINNDKLKEKINILKVNSEIDSNNYENEIEKIYNNLFGKKVYDGICIHTNTTYLEALDSMGEPPQLHINEAGICLTCNKHYTECRCGQTNESKLEINLFKTDDYKLLDELLIKTGMFKESNHYQYIKYTDIDDIKY